MRETRSFSHPLEHMGSAQFQANDQVARVAALSWHSGKGTSCREAGTDWVPQPIHLPAVGSALAIVRAQLSTHALAGLLISCCNIAS